MTNLELATEVWGHLGMPVNSITDGSKEATNFTRLLPTSRKRVIFNVAPRAFAYPFIPNLIHASGDDDNPWNNQNVYLWPSELLQLIQDENTLTGLPSLGGTSLRGGSPVLSNVTQLRPAYDAVGKRKIIVSNDTYEGTNFLVGLFEISNLDYWGDQLLETLSLYMAWLLSPIANSGSGQDRAMLKREHADSEAKSKIYEKLGGTDRLLDNRAPFADVIDFNTGGIPFGVNNGL